MNIDWSLCVVNDVPTLSCIEVVFGRILFIASGLIIFSLLIIFIIGSLQYMTSDGNPEKLKKSRATFMWAFMGTFLFVASFLMLKTIDVLFLGDQGRLFTLDIPHFTSSSRSAPYTPQTLPVPQVNTPEILIPPPQEVPVMSTQERDIHEDIDFLLDNYTDNKKIYEYASRLTGVPVSILAGIHVIEGGAEPTRSLVSGRIIGQNEPDVVRVVKRCDKAQSVIGQPIAVSGGGCGFATLLDSAVYAGRVLQSKTNGNLSSFERMVTALARYNGLGNSNCGRTPYINCPRSYEGEDHPYPLNFFDTRHEDMYRVYCKDGVKCASPRKFMQPGVLTVALTYENNK